VAQHRKLFSDEVNDRDGKVTKTMQHQNVTENLINQGTEGSGTYIKVDKGMLISKIPGLTAPMAGRAGKVEKHRLPPDSKTKRF
jgi:hypothetical protein